MRTFYCQKRIVVTPGITGETINSCWRPALIRSRAFCKISILRHINNEDSKVHLLLVSIKTE